MIRKGICRKCGKDFCEWVLIPAPKKWDGVCLLCVDGVDK